MTRAFSPRFTRTVDLYGEDAFARIRAGGVVVAGLGGVGSHVALALARSGIGRLLLIDHDVVTTSSLNRHPTAGPDDVGRAKVTVLATELRRQCPDTEIDVAVERLRAGSLERLLPATQADALSVLVDAIDSVGDKSDLIAHAVAQGRRTIVSLGAAGKVDPGLLRAGTLAESRVCPLGRAVRRGVRARGVDPAAVLAVWSEEAPRRPVEAAPGESLPDEPGVTRRQPSNMMVPGMVGYALAALAVAQLARG